MKKIILIIIAVVVVLVLVRVAATPKAPQEVFKIGGAFALTDYGSQWGEADRNGAQLAIDEINKDGKKFELIVEDTASNQVKTLSAVQKLATIDKVNVIVGPTWMDSYQAAVPVSESENIIMIAPNASITALQSEKVHQNIFATWYRTDAEMAALFNYFNSQDDKKVALMFQQDPFWQDLSRMIKDHSATINTQIVDEVKFNSSETDFRTYLQKLKVMKPDVVFFGLDNEKAWVSFLKQRQALYPELQIATTEWISEYINKPEYQGLFNGLVFIQPDIHDRSFVEKYSKKYGAAPTLSASNSYDTIMIVYQAVESGARTTEEIRKFLKEKTFKTVSFGETKFDELNGLMNGSFKINKVENNEVKEIK